MNKNFGLTESTFNELLESLQQGDETLFEKVFLTHFKDCQQYLIRHYQASPEDAYDATMGALLEFCKGLKAGKIRYGNLRFLFTRMAGQIYLKWIKKNKRLDSIEGVQLPEPAVELDEADHTLLDLAWKKLGAPCQTLLKAFFYDGISLNLIAEQNNRNPTSVRKQKQRCVEKLRSYFLSFVQSNQTIQS